jgi:hypothetical protein
MVKRAISLLTVLALLSTVAPAQSGRYAYFGRYQKSGTSGKITLQLPSDATVTSRMISMQVNCPSAACSITYHVLGGTATTTAATLYRMRSRTPETAQTLFFTESNATGGTALPSVDLPSGFVGTLEMDDFEILPGQALSISWSSSSQTVSLYPRLEEF